jgi:hypothetical protein
MTADLLLSDVVQAGEPETGLFGHGTALVVTVERHGVLPGWMPTVVRRGVADYTLMPVCWSRVPQWLERVARVDLAEVRWTRTPGGGRPFWHSLFAQDSPTCAATTSSLYFIQAGADGPIKIGVAGNVGARLKTLQTASPFPLRLLAVVPGDVEDERSLHRRFASDRLSGEWFRPSDALAAHIRGIM